MSIDHTMQRQKQYTKNRALIIAVSEYQHQYLKGKHSKGLDFCKKDGIEMSRVLESQGYQVCDKKKIIGEVKFSEMRNPIIDFFTAKNIAGNELLLFYYSGHGIPGSDDDIYLASSEIDPEVPIKGGFAFVDLTKLMNITPSTKVVCILDCCYSGSAKLSKGSEHASAKIANKAIRNKSNESLKQGKAKCLLAASQAAQEAYAKKKEDHSIFTYYLLEGLRKNKESVDKKGNVTADTLAAYVYRSIANLPPKDKPKQEPIKKVEAGDDIVLAKYPYLAYRSARKIISYKDRNTKKYVEMVNKTYSKSFRFEEVLRLAEYWITKFSSDDVLPISEIDSFENGFILGIMYHWLTSEGKEYTVTRFKITFDDLIPQIHSLRKLHHSIDDTSINRDIKQRILKIQRGIANTLGEIYNRLPP